LAAAEPDIADEHVFERDGVLAGDGELARRGAGACGGVSGRRRLWRPAVAEAVAIAELDGDRFAGVGRAQMGMGEIALEDKVVGEDAAGA